MIGFEDYGGSKNSPWEQKVDELFYAPLEKNKKKRKVKIKGYTGKLGSETKTITVPRQRRQKCLLVLLSVSRKIYKRMKVPL